MVMNAVNVIVNRILLTSARFTTRLLASEALNNGMMTMLCVVKLLVNCAVGMCGLVFGLRYLP